ncbi:hypothetical protein QVD99_006538 [Batrachochytrium dendrobatidis]|nr:hypothetical protein O5D80_002547 [Batrachochytrium dendrobatidis]KAK5666907.1 hypothetical protein QVD99_006538 [Batrachochytrium dendrobatidis]
MSEPFSYHSPSAIATNSAASILKQHPSSTDSLRWPSPITNSKTLYKNNGYEPFKFGKDSIFHTESLSSEPNTSSAPVCSLKHSTTDAHDNVDHKPAAAPILRNSIFDTVQSISKPAIKMTYQELACLREGLDIRQAESSVGSNSPTVYQIPNIVHTPTTENIFPNIENAQRSISPQPYLPGKDVRSMTVPLTLDSHSSHPQHWPLATAVNASTIPDAKYWGTHFTNTDTAYLRNINAGGRRGFVDLDELCADSHHSSQTPVQVESLANSSAEFALKSTRILPTLSKPYETDTKQRFNHGNSLQPSIEASLEIIRSGQSLKQSHNLLKGNNGQLDSTVSSPITHPAGLSRINLSFLPTKRNFLGKGRYAEVYKGSYTLVESPLQVDSPIHTDTASDTTPSTTRRFSTTSNQSDNTPFYPCAVKRMYTSSEAQSIGLAESFILRRVAGLHPNIVQLIGVKDEADINARCVKTKLVQSLGTFTKTNCVGPLSVSTLDASPISSAHSATACSALQSPSYGAGTSTLHSLPPDPTPQLILVLEYLPNGNLWDWILAHGESIGKLLWLKWARELAGALAAIHSIGIVHHDIKPHNILIGNVLDVRLADFGNACFIPEMGPSRALEELSPCVNLPCAPISDSTHNSPNHLAKESDIAFEMHVDETVQNDTKEDELDKIQASQAAKRPSVGSKRPGSLPPQLKIPSTCSIHPSLARIPTPVLPGSPISPNSQSLINGLGRGTLAYSAPDLLNPATAYSFPVDVYSLGVTLFALISGHEPFGLARSSVHMMVGIQRGFFESGLQKSGSGKLASVGLGQRKGSIGSTTGGVVGDPSDGVWRFLNGESVCPQIVGLVMRMVHRDPSARPSALQVMSELAYIDAAV